ncbi:MULTISPECIES: SRPBCC family protein [unclassified Pseudomonas]|uniref:SRPBCC family protein n=1 Tax=unclassified Pseudomonas TaxID=196821 RepID=UPI000EA9C6B5|nr:MULTISPECIES: SRPBCC family protein [unclassified Pseudomonas]AYF86850.1 SRPBCC family protein [Pseudomonas sp. DY-1]MDH4652261.1 SRPBCC family protein [Pseudomonas sp. BN606]
MSNAYASIDLHVSADQVWQLIGGFDSLPDWLPYIPKSALSEGGRIRTLQSIEGKTIIERLLAFSESERSYTYTILQGPAPVRDYQATLRVLANGHGSKVEWFGSFTPDGISEAEAEAMFEEIYKGGLAALKQTLEG